MTAGIFGTFERCSPDILSYRLRAHHPQAQSAILRSSRSLQGILLLAHTLLDSSDNLWPGLAENSPLQRKSFRNRVIDSSHPMNKQHQVEIGVREPLKIDKNTPVSILNQTFFRCPDGRRCFPGDSRSPQSSLHGTLRERSHSCTIFFCQRPSWKVYAQWYPRRTASSMGCRTAMPEERRELGSIAMSLSKKKLKPIGSSMFLFLPHVPFHPHVLFHPGSSFSTVGSNSRLFDGNVLDGLTQSLSVTSHSFFP